MVQGLRMLYSNKRWDLGTITLLKPSISSLMDEHVSPSDLTFCGSMLFQTWKSSPGGLILTSIEARHACLSFFFLDKNEGSLEWVETKTFESLGRNKKVILKGQKNMDLIHKKIPVRLKQSVSTLQERASDDDNSIESNFDLIDSVSSFTQVRARISGQWKSSP